MNDSGRDDSYMNLAIAEAQKCYSESKDPKPLVGAVLVRGNQILGRAYRGELAPGEHAEYTLLERKLADVNLDGSTLYTTLEPCTSRNDPKVPCAHRIVERKISHVHIGMLDPNPHIRGQGYQVLREANVSVTILPAHAPRLEDLNRAFARHIVSRGARRRKRRVALTVLASVVALTIVGYVLPGYLTPEPKVTVAVSSRKGVGDDALVQYSDKPFSEPVAVEIALLNEGRAAGHSYSLDFAVSPELHILRMRGGGNLRYSWPNRHVTFRGDGVSLHRGVKSILGSLEIRLPRFAGAAVPIALYNLTGDFEPSAGLVQYDPSHEQLTIESCDAQVPPKKWTGHLAAWNERAWVGRAPEQWKLAEQYQPQGLASVSDYVFWGVRPEGNGPAIMMARLSGTDVRGLVSSEHQPASVAAIKTKIFWTEPNSGRVMEGTASDDHWSAVRVRAIAVGQDSPAGIAVSNDALYWTTRTAIGTAGTADKKVVVFAQRRSVLGSIVVHGSRVCWGELGTTTTRGAVVCQAPGGLPQTVFSGVELPTALASDGTNLLVGTHVPGDIIYGRVWRIGPDGRTTLLADGQTPVRAIRAEPDRVVWLSGDGDVRAIIAGNEDVRLLASGYDHPFDVVLSGRLVLWTNQGGTQQQPDGSVVAAELPE